MKKFRITQREEWKQTFEVEAEDKEEALEKFMNGSYEEKGLEFSHTIADSVGKDEFTEVKEEEKKKYVVTIGRTETRYADIEVSANSEAEAYEIAEGGVGNIDFNELKGDPDPLYETINITKGE